MGYDKSKTRIEQDYSRNAIEDKKIGDTKAANYEANQALKVAAGEPIRMMSQATMGDRMSPLDYSGNNMKLRSNINMMGDPNAMTVRDIEQGDAAGQSLGTGAVMMKKGMDKATDY